MLQVPHSIDIVNMKKNNKRNKLIAPCGMDCGICSHYLAYSHHFPKRKGVPQCIGCRERNKLCAFVKRDCDLLRKNKVKFCFECETFPCDNLKRIDKKYTDRYQMSFIANLHFIRDEGLNGFVQNQDRKYRCPECGDTVCIHNNKCYTCSGFPITYPRE
jgi:hypothetical protein